MRLSAVSAEKHPNMVGAVFENSSGAEHAAEVLSNEMELGSEQIDIIQPQDPSLGRKLEPEVEGIKHTLIRSHITLGIAGVAGGIILALALFAAGVMAVVSSLGLAIIAMGFVGGMLGMFAAGLFAIRPDHDPMINKAREASKQGRWMVLVHTRSHEQEARARSRLEQYSDQVLSTL